MNGRWALGAALFVGKAGCVTCHAGPPGLRAPEQSDLVAFMVALSGPGADPAYQHSP